MAATTAQRTFIHDINPSEDQEVAIRGWVFRLRGLSKTTFIILRDCSGEVQCVAATDAVRDLHLKLDDTIEVYGKVRVESRSRYGYEIDVISASGFSRSRQ